VREAQRTADQLREGALDEEVLSRVRDAFGEDLKRRILAVVDSNGKVFQNKEEVESIARDVQGLVNRHRVGELFTDAKSLVAYFLAYRFLDLTSYTRRPADAKAASVADRAAPSEDRANPGLVAHYALPFTADQLALLASAPGGPDPAGAIPLINRVIRAIPWLAGVSEANRVRVVADLLELGVLEVAYDTTIQLHEFTRASVGTPPNGIPVLRLRAGFRPADPGLARAWEVFVAEALDDERSRRGLITDLGLALGITGGASIARVLRGAARDDTIKIATYHLQTVYGGTADFVDLLRANPQMRIRILCLGAASRPELNEGAHPDSLQRSLRSGIADLRERLKEYPDAARRLDIRLYGDRIEDALFRGTIRCDSSGDVKAVQAVAWPFAASRANYGEVLELHHDSNLARLMSHYFDRAWGNSVPSAWVARPDTVHWILEPALQNLEQIAAALILIVAAVTYAFLSTSVEAKDAVLFALGAAIPLIAGLIKAAQRARRLRVNLKP
jgi:hypothetical protein